MSKKILNEELLDKVNGGADNEKIFNTETFQPLPVASSINDSDLQKVNGGTDIVNADTRTQEELEKEEIEREIKRLQDILNSGGQSYKEAMELMSKITKLMRELEGYDQTIICKN